MLLPSRLLLAPALCLIPHFHAAADEPKGAELAYEFLVDTSDAPDQAEWARKAKAL